MTDINSVYSENAAIYGGVYHLESTNAKFNDTVFKYNYASQGGVFYINGIGLIKIFDSEFKYNAAVIAGGAIYATSSSSSTSTLEGIFLYNSYFENHHSIFQAGVLYLNF